MNGNTNKRIEETQQEQNPLVNSIYQNLISIKNENGLSKYKERARFLLYRVPIWIVPQTQQPPPFIIETDDLTEDIKKEIMPIFALDKGHAKSVVKDAVCLVFDLLDDIKSEYFHERVEEMMEVMFV